MKEDNARKHLMMFLVMQRWKHLSDNNIGIDAYFRRNNYSNIIIYGMGYIGNELYKDLSSIGSYNIICDGVSCDKDSDKTNENKNPDPDIVVITSDYYYFEIYTRIKDYYKCPIVSVGDIMTVMEYMY